MKRSKISIVLAAAVVLAVVGIFGFVLGRSQPVVKKTDDKSATAKSIVKSAEDSSTETKTPEPGKSTRNVVLYFSDSNAEYLIPEPREISVENAADVYKAAVAALIKGPADAGHFPTMPANMVVAGVTVDSGMAQVDLGVTMNNLIPQGTTGERMFIYSIVDTLTEFPEVTQVRFLAGGATPLTPGSRVDWTYAFTRNEALIRH